VCIESVGFGFMFAPSHHAATRHVVPVRKELAVRTVFNFLGPLTNPAGATRQLIGVFDPAHLEVMASALEQLGGVHALVVSSEDGLDEVSVSGPTQVFELRDGRVEGRTVTPTELGLDTVPAETIPAGDPAFNADVTRRALAGVAGPERTLVLANAGAAIYVAGVASSIEQGVRAAERAIDSGAAEDALARYVERTRQLAAA
jgi:anthranilate phosphoribosyltransferase